MPLSSAPLIHKTYIAIDFETADYARDSACAIGLARIEKGHIVNCLYSLLRPPTQRMRFTKIHGLTWQDVKDAPTFAEFSPQILNFIQGAEGFVAHNAPFDQGVFAATCRSANIPWPEKPFFCTCKGARAKLDLKRHRLSDVCTHLCIDLQHHHAGSDALAAGHVFLRLHAMGVSLQSMRIHFNKI